ncbi:hypothetical protein DPMN_016293 [Dreissena polymorpha]|uniref:Uncharacterized protein n=1 Tax=Dreissena polymorpha TaxID=45954 RepID=A0A9D4ND78_DREPO|nr:hypothetical protein DPMN_016293 [Dreissena polymorpha]
MAELSGRKNTPATTDAMAVTYRPHIMKELCEIRVGENDASLNIRTTYLPSAGTHTCHRPGHIPAIGRDKYLPSAGIA